MIFPFIWFLMFFSFFFFDFPSVFDVDVCCTNCVLLLFVASLENWCYVSIDDVKTNPFNSPSFERWNKISIPSSNNVVEILSIYTQIFYEDNRSVRGYFYTVLLRAPVLGINNINIHYTTSSNHVQIYANIVCFMGRLSRYFFVCVLFLLYFRLCATKELLNFTFFLFVFLVYILILSIQFLIDGLVVLVVFWPFFVHIRM